MEIGNQMQNYKIDTNSKLVFEDGSIWSTLIFIKIIGSDTLRFPLPLSEVLWDTLDSENRAYSWSILITVYNNICFGCVKKPCQRQSFSRPKSMFVCVDSQSTVFHSCWDRSSWVEWVLGRGHNAVPLVRLELPTPRFRVKHSTTEPSPFYKIYVWYKKKSLIIIGFGGYNTFMSTSL